MLSLFMPKLFLSSNVTISVYSGTICVSFDFLRQVKIFCDKGAERKLRDEERRAAKRRMTPSGKRRLDEMYHETHER
jgi:hypothetical protein